MPRIIPLRELNNSAKVSRMCHEDDTPIFVTKNGVSDMVILSSDAYDNLSVERIVEEKLEANSLNEYMSIRDSKPLYSIAEIKKTLRPIFEKHDVKKAILFGSYVKGTADSRSDIDIVVESNLKGLKFYGLLGDVSDALRFPVDLIERRQIEKGSDFEIEVDETGVTIYG